MTEVVGIMWIIIAVIAACLAMYVMLMADFNRRGKSPSWLPDARKAGFFVASVALISSAIAVFDGWTPEPISLVLLAICTLLLAGNALSAYYDGPPPRGSKLRWAVRRGSRKDRSESLARSIIDGRAWGNRSHQE